jgi:hypothetical protein
VSTFVRVSKFPAPRLGGMVVDGVSQWNKKEKKESLKYACLREWTTGNHNTFFLVSLSSIHALFIGRRLYHHHRLTPIPPPPLVPSFSSISSFSSPYYFLPLLFSNTINAATCCSWWWPRRSLRLLPSFSSAQQHDDARTASKGCQGTPEEGGGWRAKA